jgi:hypothetical protein
MQEQAQFMRMQKQKWYSETICPDMQWFRIQYDKKAETVQHEKENSNNRP